jgi:monothiol glutaredoxin
MSMQEIIKKQLVDNPVVLYMKGTPAFPQCGFSGRAVYILRECNAEFMAVNVLEEPDMREGIKQYSQWPTIPQLYINGKLIGGSDIMIELHDAGKLQKLLNEA